MTTIAQLDALSKEFYGWIEDKIASAQARHDVPAGYCPYCESAYGSPDGGWCPVFPDDPYSPEPLRPGDIGVEAWGGLWYRACEACNPEGERFPTVPVTFAEVMA